MREILFIGKRRNGEWVQGNLLCYPDVKRTFITVGDYFKGEACEVGKETVGQFTGKTDKNGKKIFEGNIVQIDEHETAVNGLYCVRWSESNSCWTLQRNEEYHHHFFTFSDLNGFAETSEIVGNIHDNPELLKGES